MFSLCPGLGREGLTTNLNTEVFVFYPGGWLLCGKYDKLRSKMT